MTKQQLDTRIPPICYMLRAARKSRGLTQGDVAKFIGVTRQTISMVECGHIVRPSKKLREGLERLYGFEIPKYIL